jgi:hypothetical protein
MVEIKIPTAAAVVLLTQRMHYELGLRVETGQIRAGNTLKNLGYQELLEIAEVSAFDIVSLLPADILAESNNLTTIVTKAMKSLSTIFEKEEFKRYSESRAEKLLLPLIDLFTDIDDKNSFIVN